MIFDYLYGNRSLAARAVEALESGFWDGVQIDCWDRAEADEVRELIPERLRSKVTTTWLRFE